MTLTNPTSSVTHNGNGVTTLWPYSFIIPDDDSARVGLFDVATSALSELPDTDYSITGIGEDAGGEVMYPLVGAPIASAKRLVIWRQVAYTQETELTNQTPYFPKVLEGQLDLIVMQVQQLAEETSRGLKVTQGSELDPDEFISELQQGAAEAAASAADAAASAASAASQALPNPGVALNYVRRNAGLTGYESRTPAQVAADISAVRYDAAQGLSVAQQEQARENISAAVRGHIFGLTVSNNAVDATNDIDVAAGEAASTETNPALMILAASITKRLDAAWAVGSGNGGRDTGAIADGTWHLFLIQRSDTGVVDVLFSQSATAPTMPTGYDRKRRIGSWLRESGVLVPMVQVGNTFYRKNSPLQEYSSTAARANALLTLAGVPSGIRTAPILSTIFIGGAATSRQVIVQIGPGDGTTANVYVNAVGDAASERHQSMVSGISTNLSAQVWLLVSISAGTISEGTVWSSGWVDDRGRNN